MTCIRTTVRRKKPKRWSAVMPRYRQLFVFRGWFSTSYIPMCCLFDTLLHLSEEVHFERFQLSRKAEKRAPERRYRDHSTSQETEAQGRSDAKVSSIICFFPLLVFDFAQTTTCCVVDKHYLRLQDKKKTEFRHQGTSQNFM